MEDQAGIEWRKSSLSTTNGCVEVAFVGGMDLTAVEGDRHDSAEQL